MAGSGFIADVVEVLLIDNNGEIFANTTLQEGNIDVTVEENEIRGGRGHQLLATLKTQRDITINLTDAEFKYDWLAMQLGQDITTGAGIAWAMPEICTVSEDLTITLKNTPLAENHGLKVYTTEGESVSYDTITDKTVTLTGVEAGDKVVARGYKYETDETAQNIEIDNAIFAKGIRAVLEAVEIDDEDRVTHKIQWQFDKCIPDGNFTINTSSERTGSQQTIGLKVVKPQNSDIVGRVIRIPYSTEA